ncbi:MAG TPA: hypothetical protein DCK95_07700 [Anaerolineaceae bacterium]|uniref:Polyprenyl synthetase n=1 Tax=Anaerolinea thermophila TaxID=167964 RepID=A0A101FZ07_9CHLR|nr:MAG: Polyprenyl synthetase [Anaerolinea thermophila]HAF62193.1 hypothetical protein [Anaerolineaceae bacterium]
MDLSDYQDLFLPAIEARLISDLHTHLDDAYPELKESIFYHFGITSEKEGGGGKRVRPLLVLLTADILGIDWTSVLPMASAVEMLHNFSLIHDDIEDHSSTRRGRLTVWEKWGIEKAVNIGDVLYSMAMQTIQSPDLPFNAASVSESALIFSRTAFELLQGQQMDMDFEGIATLQTEDYLKMIAGKTGALLAYSCEVSAILRRCTTDIRNHLWAVGMNLGLSFQVYDDWLGIWGEERQTGKPTFNDLLAHKVSYPVLLGLSRSADFRELWLDDQPPSTHKVQRMAELLVKSGIDREVLVKSEEYNNLAISFLEKITGNLDSKNALQDLLKDLVKRKK